MSADLTRCYQIMQAEMAEHLRPWIDAWSDLADFEVVPVVTSAEAAASVRDRMA